MQSDAHAHIHVHVLIRPTSSYPIPPCQTALHFLHLKHSTHYYALSLPPPPVPYSFTPSPPPFTPPPPPPVPPGALCGRLWVREAESLRPVPSHGVTVSGAYQSSSGTAEGRQGGQNRCVRGESVCEGRGEEEGVCVCVWDRGRGRGCVCISVYVCGCVGVSVNG